MIISLMVAKAKNGVIGNKGELPWKLPKDLKYFKETTMGHPIVMGRKTFDSIGRVLPGRENIILSRNSDLSIEGATVKNSLEKSLIYLIEKNCEEVFIIGGEEIFKASLNMAQKLYVTEIHSNFEGDAFFPEFDKSKYEVKILKKEKEPFAHDYCVYSKNENHS